MPDSRPSAACGLDFGASNSAIAVADAEAATLVPLEGDAPTIPSAIFFATEPSSDVFYGRAAVREYLDGTPGRLMRSLKSVLGSALIDERVAIGDRDYRYADVITAYLRMLRQRAEYATDRTLDSVVLGRPVRFVDDDAGRDRAAETTLAACARSAGFRNVEFQFEPIAAAFDYERTIDREALVLVVDVGGGTADFTVIRLGPARRNRMRRADDILANDGIHVAGTDFDSRLHLAWVMPVLGYRSVGVQGRIVPSPVYFELSTWHRIDLLHAPKFSARLRDLRAFFTDARAYERLMHVIAHQLGHDLLGRTEAAKIALSQIERSAIDLDVVERGLRIDVRRDELVASLEDMLARLVQTATATVAAAGLEGADIDTLYFTGGSSGMNLLRETFATAYPVSDIVVGNLYGSVASGLGIEAQRRFDGVAPGTP